MNFHVNFVLWCVLVVTKQCLTVKKCVQRRSGACKILRSEYSFNDWDFHSLPPDGFVLKTSMEIDLLKNIHNFENNVLVEKKRPVRYTLDNAALVRIKITINYSHFITISLGKKHYRLAKLEYWDFKFKETQYSRFTPILPTFPYNLRLEITTNGTFSILADANTEPFLKYQIKFTGPFHVNSISFNTEGNNDDLIAIVDCWMKYKPNCGVGRVEKLYGCREWVGNFGRIDDFNGFRKVYGEGVLFDEFIVVDIEYSAQLSFNLEWNSLDIDFRVNSTEVTFDNGILKKSVRTEQWFQVPASPYAVRVSITTDGEHDYVLKIINLQFQKILSLKLCGISNEIKSLIALSFSGPKFYFDCLTLNDSADKIVMSERPRKTNETRYSQIQYHTDGYNYTKEYLDTWDFVGQPYVTYQYKFGKSTKDWCPDEPQPEVLVTLKYADDSLEGIIERSNAILHSDLQKLYAQNNETADTNAALLTELKKVSAQINATAHTNADVFDELKVISDALITHLRQNATSANNSSYSNNQLNVTDFLKQN